MTNTITVGTKVVFYSRQSGRVVHTSKVAKVYKNGNVLIESRGKQQYKPSGPNSFRSTKLTAREFGGSYDHCAVLTPEVEAKLQVERSQTEKVERARAAITVLRQLPLGILDDESVEELENLAKRLLRRSKVQKLEQLADQMPIG